MKVLAIVAAVCLVSCYAAINPEEAKATLKAAIEDCIKETGVDAEVIGPIMKGGKITREEKIDKYFHCYLKKIGITKEDGSIDANRAIDLVEGTTSIDHAKVIEIIDKCKTVEGENPMDKSAKFAICWLEG